MIALTGANHVLAQTISAILHSRGQDTRILGTEADQWQEELQGCRTVYHCLEHLDVSNRSQEFYDINVTATERLMRAAAAAGVRRVLHVSSIVAAGPAQHYNLRTEDEPADPLPAPYAETKRMGEKAALRIAAETGVEVVIVRSAFMVGRGTRFTARYFAAFAHSKFRAIPGNRHHTYNFIGLEDCAHGCILAMEKGQNNEIYTLAGDAHLTLQHTMQLFSQLSGLPPARDIQIPLFVLLLAVQSRNAVPGIKKDLAMTPEFVESYLTWNWIFSNEKAKRELGFAPTPIENSWQDAILWATESGMVHRPIAERVKDYVRLNYS
jgi:dihydroflavonol-4-reductase